MKEPLIPEKLESPGFLPPGSQIRNCKAGDLHEGTASLCYHCAWDGAGQKSILEFQVVPVQLAGTMIYKDFSHSFGKSLCWNTTQPTCYLGAAPSVHTNSDSICTIVIWALHRYARK